VPARLAVIIECDNVLYNTLMITKKPPRKKTFPDVETAVLAKSARRCTLCFHLKGDLTEKHGQIAHLDDDRTNRKEDNLAWMCLDHHSLYDSKTKQHKNYTIHEVKAARTKLYDLVAEGKHLTPAAAQPYLQAEADKKVLRDFMETVPSNGSITFLRTNNFAGFSFEWKRLEDLEAFFHDRNGPDHEFLDPELEAARQNFRKSCRALLGTLAINTFTTDTKGWQAVPDDWEIKTPERFDHAVTEIHAAAEAVCCTYDDLVRLARNKLAV
jgi:hypothetical protein